MAGTNPDEIASQIISELASTRYACSSLTPLSGGTANFLFRGALQKPLEDGTAEVVVKHGEAFSASWSDLKLSQRRCAIEKGCLESAGSLPPISNPRCSVRTPRLLHWNPDSSTQVQEYLPNSLDLKSYALKNFTASTPASERPRVVEVGKGLGAWLHAFHNWAASPEQQRLQDSARSNKDMQGIKMTYNYELLLGRVERFPTVLQDARPVFEKLIEMAKAELDNEDELQVIHGDFWTGNILLPDEEMKPDRQTPLFVIDWEMCLLWTAPLDLGQMIAELYELTLYKDIKAGLWLIEGFVTGYGFMDDEFAYRTALHVGTHLVGFGSMVSGWGTPEQQENVARTGRDIILKAWQRDRAWFEGHDLAPLFRVDSYF